MMVVATCTGFSNLPSSALWRFLLVQILFLFDERKQIRWASWWAFTSFSVFREIFWSSPRSAIAGAFHNYEG